MWKALTDLWWGIVHASLAWFANGETRPLRIKLFLAGVIVLTSFHTLVALIIGWPKIPNGVPVAYSITEGFAWGISGMLLLLFGAILVGPYGGRTIGGNMKLGAFFLYGVFLAHAIFDTVFGGDWVDPVLYAASAAFVVWFAATIFDLCLKE